jgi:hypothetical protein
MAITQFRAFMPDLPSFLKPSDITVGPDMPNPRPQMDTCPYPRNDENNNCQPRDRYRTYDGTCNNLKRPLWGKSMRPLERFLAPDYADGMKDNDNIVDVENNAITEYDIALM